MTEKLQLKEILAAVDSNVRDLWDAADDENKKVIKGDLFRLNRYISNVQRGNKEIKAHFVLSVNEYFNKHWDVLSKHPKLLWLLLCMCSYDNKTIFYHEWIGNKKKTGNNDKKIEFLAELYPTMKMSDVELLATQYTDNELSKLAIDLGMLDTEIKKIFK